MARRTRDRVLPAAARPRSWRKPPCAWTIERTTLANGTRHATYLDYVCLLVGIGMARVEIMLSLIEIDARNPIKDHDYLIRVGRAAGRYSRRPRCPGGQLKAFCDPTNCYLAQTRWSKPAQGFRTLP